MVKGKNKDEEVSSTSPLTSKLAEKLKTKDTPQEESVTLERKMPISISDLNTEKGIREYLIGEWVYDQDYGSDIICKMHIDVDLKVGLSFYNAYTNQDKGDYTGEIKLDWVHADPNGAPDLLSIKLKDTEDSGGEFFFKHRTTYDEKHVMSWFFLGNENCVFNLLGAQGYEDAGPEYVPRDIMFEKVSGEKSSLSPRKNDEFYAVYWGMGSQGKSLWLDDARWTPEEEGEVSWVYPREMTCYENDVPESILYNIAPHEMGDILGDDLFPGQIYFVQTDEDGNVIHFIGAERKRFLEQDWDEEWVEEWSQEGDGETDLDSEKETLIIDIIENDVEEVAAYLKAGMSIMITGGTMMLDDEAYYLVELGTDHKEHFVTEIFYAVNIITRQVYRYDVLDDRWELVT